MTLAMEDLEYAYLEDSPSDCSVPQPECFRVAPDYDYHKSTEQNYSTDVVEFVGKYAALRSKLDYDYHKHYTPSRQLLHDQIISRFTEVEIDDGEYTCEVPEENWLVFTAGPMGCGKSHVLKFLHQKGLFPLKAFVQSDPDELRVQLPEFLEYSRRNAGTAGRLTHKEAGYISEVLTLHALEDGKNALVDGSLRDRDWYGQYIAKLKSAFPRLKIAIIQVSASKANVLSRALKRAESTGRLVPEDVILQSMDAIPDSVAALRQYADFMAEFVNDEEPLLLRSSGEVNSMDNFRDVWNMTCLPNQPRIQRGSKRSMSDLELGGSLQQQTQKQARGAEADLATMTEAYGLC